MLNILIADSVGSSRESLKSALSSCGSVCGFCDATDGNTAVSLFKSMHFDLILSDVMLPLLDGFSLCRQIRNISADVPFIFVSTKCDNESKIKAFESGADDYVCRPFCEKELVLRINAVMRRCGSSATDSTSYTRNLGKLSVDTSSCTVKISGNPLKLRKKEYELLTLFIENKGKVLKRESIIDTIWQDKKSEGSGRALDSHIKNLRKQLGECGDMITTFHGIGYKFDCQ